MLILNKSFATIQKKAEEEMASVGINITPGAIARLFMSIINSEQAEFYSVLSLSHMQCFVSTATGDYLDSIGKLLHCSRLLKETDDNYRYRITNQVLSLSSANQTAIRLAALSVTGVDDVGLLPFSHGIGSFTVYILNNTDEITTEKMLEVKKAIDSVVGYGIKYTVALPTKNTISLELKLMFNSTVSISTQDEVKIKVKKAVINYINNLEISQPFIMNEFTSLVMQQHDDISNYSILSFKINDAEAMHTNQYCEATEKFVISSQQYSIKVY